MPATLEPTAISAEEFAAILRGGRSVDIVDVRTPGEFRGIHIDGARNVPLDQLNPATVMSARIATTDPLYVVCKSGSRGRLACEKFRAAGFTNVININGGTMACAAAGIPVVRGKGVISLDRQTRIVIGLGVLTGSLLAYFVHPAWAGLSGFFGAGLIFAGVTDSCALATLIGKMPWNQVAASSPTGEQACAVTKPSTSAGDGPSAFSI
jgi:rhodanese-related sulfurtransferase